MDDKVNDTFALVITRCHFERNHRLSEYSLKGHSSKCISLDEAVLQTVNEL